MLRRAFEAEGVLPTQCINPYQASDAKFPLFLRGPAMHTYGSDPHFSGGMITFITVRK
ncbi:unnamed protein product [marine sediment metagenome]|uniref:Uncharacterized protein n=1 Tax=marine sediment metagenome TaxID=412755 RepID=X0XZ73_9ZZZZ